MDNIFLYSGLYLAFLMVLSLYRPLFGPTVVDRMIGVNAIGTKTTVLLILIGLIFRTAWLESFPRIQAGDEAQFAYESVALKDKLKWEYSPFEMGIWHHPRTYHTLIALAVDVFGQTKTAARLPSAIFGALTVPAVYFMGRRLFDHRIGLIAAIFMMSFPVARKYSMCLATAAGPAWQSGGK